MGIGYLLLYAALALVALWLVAELLLQSRAPLHWRAVALGGFLCVVAGMQLQSVIVIGLGAAAFAVGQVFVTLSVKRGQPVGWSLRRPDGSLPGPLARVPLLAAATGGVAAAPAVAAVPQVGEVGPIEDEQPAAPFAYEQLQEIGDDGVYAEEPAAQTYYQQPDQQQQQGYYQQGYEQQQWQQQPVYGYDAYGQPVYQDPYAQQQQYQQQYQATGWTDPQAAQQQQSWEYQQQYQQAYGYQQPQTWDYQQQS
ncbi:hypothetical protein [Kitasatospora cinereorecta]|uniref:hypothetical protein n=1 Tax=Kitasatospora cinereorecta TaxID=285560 RepID=UPI0031F8CDDB